MSAHDGAPYVYPVLSELGEGRVPRIAVDVTPEQTVLLDDDAARELVAFVEACLGGDVLLDSMEIVDVQGLPVTLGPLPQEQLWDLRDNLLSKRRLVEVMERTVDAARAFEALGDTLAFEHAIEVAVEDGFRDMGHTVAPPSSSVAFAGREAMRLAGIVMAADAKAQLRLGIEVDERVREVHETHGLAGSWLATAVLIASGYQLGMVLGEHTS